MGPTANPEPDVARIAQPPSPVAVVQAPSEPTAAADTPATPAPTPVAAPTNSPAPQKTVVKEKRTNVARQPTPRSKPVRVARRSIAKERVHLTQDERIRSEVMKRLAANGSITGHVHVESRGAVVRLTGATITVAQAQRAEREARRVPGVQAVRNDIRPRIGPSPTRG
jgi:hypothetical protein